MPTLPTLEDIYKLSNIWRRKMKKNTFAFSRSPSHSHSLPCLMCGSQWGVRETQKRPHFSHISISICFCRIFTHFWVKIWLYQLAFAWCLIDMSFKRSSYSGTPKIRKANTVWLIGRQESNKVKVAQGKVGWNRGWWWPTNAMLLQKKPAFDVLGCKYLSLMLPCLVLRELRKDELEWLMSPYLVASLVEPREIKKNFPNSIFEPTPTKILK